MLRSACAALRSELRSAPLRKPLLRCSTPSSSSAPTCSDAMHFAPLRNPADAPLRTSAALILHGAPLRSPPLRCSKLLCWHSALRCSDWDAIAQLTWFAAAHRRKCNLCTGATATKQQRSGAAAHWRKRSLTRSGAAAHRRKETTAQQRSAT